MKDLIEYKEQIHSCSKCGLCQSVCPIYKITGNDCTVSRGHFIMLMGLIKGELKMTKTLNKYLDLCLKCNACSKFCPSGIDVVKIIASAKAEYFKNSTKEKIISLFQKYFIFGLGIKLLSLFKSKNFKSDKNYQKNVLYFGGCGAKVNGVKNITKILNSLGIGVITPDFDCCGFPFYVRGDFENFEYYKNRFVNIVKKYEIKDIVTTCATCEKAIKSYGIPNLNIKNVFDYIAENELPLKIKKHKKVTFHKPCNLDNFETVKKILNSTENLEYVEMKDFDKCCGFNGIFNIKEFKIIKNLLFEKRKNIISSGAKTVLTSCLGCESVLKLISLGQYKTEDFTDFLAKNLE